MSWLRVKICCPDRIDFGSPLKGKVLPRAIGSMKEPFKVRTGNVLMRRVAIDSKS